MQERPSDIFRTLQADSKDFPDAAEEDEKHCRVSNPAKFTQRGTKPMQSNLWKALPVLGLAAVIMLACGLPAAAQSENQNQGLELVGSWRVQVTQVDCQTGVPLSPTAFPSLLTFAFGGTMAEDTTNPASGPGQRGASQGVWRYEGHRTYRVRSVAFINYTTPPNPAAHNPGFEAGEQTIVQTITFKDDRDAWTSVASIEFTDATGAVYRQGCAVASAQRF